MDLLTFISHDSFSEMGQIFCFISKNTSVLFAKIFKKKFENIAQKITVLTDLESEFALKAYLEMSFLGQTTVFWMNEDLLLSHPLINSYLSLYSGPNLVGYVSKNLIGGRSKIISIEVPEELNYEQFKQIFIFLYPDQAQKSLYSVSKIFKQYAVLNIHSILMVMHYCMLLGTKSDTFLQEWLPDLLNPEKSLFLLSTLLFSKKDQQFFQLWAAISDDYSEPFWSTYWSEQFFRATLFCYSMNLKNYTQAKRIAFRLPFSFVQKDWKFVTVEDLKYAHNQLYTIDWNIKNGFPAHFENFYLQFMR